VSYISKHVSTVAALNGTLVCMQTVTQEREVTQIEMLDKITPFLFKHLRSKLLLNYWPSY
jgi:hypothetical protein